MIQKKMQNEKIVLSISLLVSNRRNTIRKCMESLRPILQSLPSELIAVDTVEEGKGDGSIDIVREYTEKIVPFVWCNDFAAARNAGLEKARGEWFMYIDDDEWLEDASPIIAFFQSGEYRKYRYAIYTVRNYTNPEGSRWADTLQGRLFPIAKDTRFVGKIHEMVYLEEPACELPCYAHHYGYAFQNTEERDKHIERNVNLLRTEYEQDKGNLRVAAHLIQEYEGGGRFAESLKVIEESFAETNCGANSKFWDFMKFHEVLDYICLKKFDKAYEKGSSYLQEKNLLMGAEIGTHCIMSEICDIMGKSEESMYHLEKYLKLVEEIKRCKNILPLTVLDLSQMWEEINVKKAYARGVNVAYQLGDLERTAYFIQKINWSEKELQVLEGTVDNTFLFFEQAPFEQWMTEVMDAILERGFARGSIDDVLATMKTNTPERKRILQILAFCKNRGVQVSGYRAEYAALTGDAALMRQALQELTDNPEGNLLMLESSILQYLYKAEINGGDYVKKVPLYRWYSCTKQWSREKELQAKRTDCFLWKGMMPEEPLYLLEMEEALQEGETLSSIVNDREYGEIYQMLLAMAEKLHEVYSRIYHPNVFTHRDILTVLPPEAQFAEKYLSAARYLEQGNEKNFVSLVKEAGMCYPQLGGACRLLLEKYQEEQSGKNRESDKAKEELAVLIQVLKGKAEGLWESGHKEEATAIISQILQIQPDAELAEKYHII